jgi:hypothetical protein
MVFSLEQSDNSASEKTYGDAVSVAGTHRNTAGRHLERLNAGLAPLFLN